MPILDDIMDHDLLGPIYRRGEKKGRQEGRQEGRREGQRQGELNVLRVLLARRFGRLPGWAEDRLSSLTQPELEALVPRVLDAPTLEAVFGCRSHNQ